MLSVSVSNANNERTRKSNSLSELKKNNNNNKNQFSDELNHFFPNIFMKNKSMLIMLVIYGFKMF